MNEGWLVYEKDNVERNRRFIQLMTESAARQGCALRLVTTDRIAVCASPETGTALRLDGAPERPGFCVMRCMEPALSEAAELAGIRVFNSALVSRTANNKQETLLFMVRNGLPFFPTALLSPGRFRIPYPWPVVIKAARGCGGRQVFRCADPGEAAEALRAVGPDDAVVQPVCDTPGRDLRVYLLGGEVLACMLRKSTDRDIRSNFGLHRNADRVTPPREILDVCEKISALLRPDLIGVDFIFHQGQPWLNEIEDAVGTRMLYERAGMDAADLYMTHILRTMKQTGGGTA